MSPNEPNGRALEKYLAPPRYGHFVSRAAHSSIRSDPLFDVPNLIFFVDLVFLADLIISYPPSYLIFSLDLIDK